MEVKLRSFILNLGTKERCAVYFTVLPFEKSTVFIEQGLRGPQGRSGHGGKEQNP
jgi:hypothetical protein